MRKLIPSPFQFWPITLSLLFLAACEPITAGTLPPPAITVIPSNNTNSTPSYPSPLPMATRLAATSTAVPVSVVSPTPDTVCPVLASPPLGVSRFTPVDGRGTIAFSADYSRDGLALLFPETNSTVAVHQLTASRLPGSDMGFAWSPDATRIAFLYSELGVQPQPQTYLMLADLSTGEICPLVEEQGMYSRPAWAPDGRWLAFTEYDSGQLKVLRLNDGMVLTLSSSVRINTNPDWVDETHVAYIRLTDIESVADLVVQPLDGSEPNILLEDKFDLRAFSFSPDGNWLAYFANGAKLRNLGSGSEHDLGNERTFLAWSPDSQSLLGVGGLAGIFLVRPSSSSEATQLDVLGCPGSQPWASNSRRFVVNLCKDGSKLSNLGIYDLDTGILTELPLADLAPFALAWSTR